MNTIRTTSRFFRGQITLPVFAIVMALIAVPLVESAPGKRAQLKKAEEMSENATRLAEKGNFPGAIQLLERALVIREKVLGPEHSDTGISLNDLARLYTATGRYADAEPLYARALAILEKVLGPEHRDTAGILNNLAGLYADTGRYAEAEPLYERARAIYEKILGAAHPYTAVNLNNLAALYQAVGRYAEAEPLYVRSLAIYEKVLGPDHTHTAAGLSNLAGLYAATGRYAEAEPLSARAVAIAEQVLGLEHPHTAKALNTHAGIYQELGRYAEAEPLFVRSLAINEKILGAAHPYTAVNLNSLAVLYLATGRYPEAEPLLKRALAINEKSLGPEHPDTARMLDNLAGLYADTGRYAEAEPLHARALAISEKVLGPAHPDTAVSLIYLALLYEATGHHAESFAVGAKCSRIETVNLRRMLNYFTETDCLAYAEAQYPYNLSGSLGSGPLAAVAQLGQKGLVMEAIGFRRRLEASLAGDGVGTALLRQRDQLAPGYRKLLLEQGESAEATVALKKRIDDLDKQINLHLQGAFGADLTLVPPAVELAEVQRNLPSGVRLLDGFRYHHRLKDNAGFEPRYAWTVIGPSSAAEPLFIPLGAAEPIEAAITEFRHWARPVDPRNKEDPRVGMRPSELAAKIQAASERLYELVWLPLVNAKALPPEVTEVVISADSQLHFLPFGLLSVDGKRFLCQDYTIRYVNSGRDLVSEPVAVTAKPKKALLVGNPLYGDNVPQRALAGEVVPTTTLEMNLRQGMAEDTRSLSFAPLTGTATEIALLKSLLEQAGYETGTFDGRTATETNVHHNVQSPGILHFATHGFFLPEPDQAATTLARLDGFGMTGDRNGFGLAQVQNPMYRSGLALAGAETTRKMWEKGDKNLIPPTESDGILLAAEAATLDLRGTELVVLSACSTAEGKALDGEGVMGLRRALAVAGARNVVMSLWAVEDEATVEFMKRFYGKYLGGTHPAIALHETTRELLLEGVPNFGLQGAISRYGAFIATTTGKLKAP